MGTNMLKNKDGHTPMASAETKCGKEYIEVDMDTHRNTFMPALYVWKREISHMQEEKNIPPPTSLVPFHKQLDYI